MAGHMAGQASQGSGWVVTWMGMPFLLTTCSEETMIQIFFMCCYLFAYAVESRNGIQQQHCDYFKQPLPDSILQPSQKGCYFYFQVTVTINNLIVYSFTCPPILCPFWSRKSIHQQYCVYRQPWMSVSHTTSPEATEIINVLVTCWWWQLSELCRWFVHLLMQLYYSTWACVCLYL